MLHEPEFESLNEEQDTAVETEAPRRTGRRIFRVVFYSAVFALVALAVGVQASPEFAATVGRNVPEPVAAAMATMTGAEMAVPVGMKDGKCCSSMSRAALMAGVESESSCCSSGSMCPMEQAAMAAAESGCCSKSSEMLAASTDDGCTGACPLSGETGENALASADSSEAISLPAPGEEAETAAEPTDDANPIEPALETGREPAAEPTQDAA